MELLRVAIVEDETPHAELLRQHIESWQKQRGMENAGLEVMIRHFCHASAFFFAWEDESYDMIFLDIQMPGINGMEIARKIRETDGEVKLVFTTGITDYMQEGYEVEAVRYLLKPINREKLWQCLDRLQQAPVPSPQLVFQTLEAVVKVSEQEIEYFEARGHYTICHLRAGGLLPGQDGVTEIKLRESFNALCERLSGRPFVRCHRSYLCGIARIHRVERTEILLESGGSVPLSRRMYETVVKAFIAYFRREG